MRRTSVLSPPRRTQVGNLRYSRLGSLRYRAQRVVFLRCSADSLVCCFADCQSAKRARARGGSCAEQACFHHHAARRLATCDTAGWAACATGRSASCSCAVAQTALSAVSPTASRRSVREREGGHAQNKRAFTTTPHAGWQPAIQQAGQPALPGAARRVPAL